MASVDLRPMTLGEVLDRTFNLYKNHFWLFAGIMALPNLVTLVINVGGAALGAGKSASFQAAQPSAGVLAGGITGGLLVLVLILFLAGAAQAATIFAVSDLYLGRNTSVRESYRRAGRKAFRVIVILILTGLAVGVGFILLIIPGIILLCRTAVAVPASMLEDTKAITSIERSLELTKGFALKILLIFILVLIMSLVVTGIFQAPAYFLTFNAISKHQQLSFGAQVYSHLAAFFSQVLVGPIGTIAFSLMYYNLRVRKEGFDIQHLMASLGTSPAPGTPATL
jgi:hypothetical protein